jgi:protein SMG6
MELDGLSANASQLGEAADAVMAYISSLSVRTEEVNFNGNHASVEKNMDDLIIKAAIWQVEHWVDRSALLKLNLLLPMLSKLFC